MNEMLSTNSFTIEDASSSLSVEWNKYVQGNSNATPYHRFDWLNAVKSAYKHNNISLVARDKETKKIVGVLPAVQLKIPLLGHKFCSLPFCDTGYALADNSEIEKALLTSLKQKAIKSKAKNCEIRDIADTTSNGEYSNPITAPVSKEVFAGRKVRMILPLPESSEVLLASFKSKLRSQIRKAEKNGLTFKLGNSADLLKSFYSVYSTNMRDLGSPAHHINWFNAILTEYGNQAIVSVVYHKDSGDRNIPIGAGIVLKNGDKACIPWASTIQAYNRLAPNMLLYWSLLAHCADNGTASFDFGRSTYNEGTFKFKKQWGAEPELLHWHDLLQPESNHLSEDATGESKIRPIVENIWRKLPLALTVTIGARVRGYISL